MTVLSFEAARLKREADAATYKELLRLAKDAVEAFEYTTNKRWPEFDRLANHLKKMRG